MPSIRSVQSGPFILHRADGKFPNAQVSAVGSNMDSFRILGTTYDKRYPAGLHGAQTAGTGTVAINTLVAVPFLAGSGGVADRLAFNVTTVGGAGSVARVGIYSNTSNGNSYPNALLVDAGEVDSTVSGIKDNTISLSLEQGLLYWFAYLCGVSAPVIRFIGSAGLLSILGYAATDFSGLAGTNWAVTQAYGALPATFPAGAVVAGGSTRPFIAVRLT